MESDLIFGEVADKNRSFEDADEDAFIFEEIRDSSDDQQVEQIMMLQPKEGMTFDSEDAAVSFYKDYAKKEGFGVIRRTTRHGEDSKLVYFTLACSRQGKAQYSSKNSFKPNPSTRMQCPAKVNSSRREEKFCITSITLDHNHAISPSKARFLRCHKKLDLHAKRRLELNDQAGIRLNKKIGSLIMEAGGYGNLEFGEKECRNYLQETRRLKLGAGDAHVVYQYFLRMHAEKRWVPAYVKDTFWAGMSSTQRSESVNAFFDGYVHARTTLKQFVEQYENALRDKVEKETKAVSKSFQEEIPCITHFDFEKQFQAAYTNAKFQEFQEQLRGKIYCYPSLLNNEGPLLTFGVREDRKIFFEGEDGSIKEKWITSDFTVLFKQEECDVQCICRLFELRDILCSHIITVLALMGIKDVPSRYILQRWRKDFKRKHLFIKCSYDDMLNTPVVQRYDELCKRSHEVAEKGAESDELRDLVMDGLDQLERKVDAYRASHAVQVQAEDPTSKHEDIMLNKEKLVLSPIPVRSVGRPRSKRKISKVDQVIQKLRAKKRQVPTSTTKVQTH
uniref:Protein FAR1-RELATED SEQUENCE n=1 Tax=Aegilops tauschii subsp. strangulata TaxID=200361 RepID=A0A453AWS1_AEGTS